MYTVASCRVRDNSTPKALNPSTVVEITHHMKSADANDVRHRDAERPHPQVTLPSGKGPFVGLRDWHGSQTSAHMRDC